MKNAAKKFMRILLLVLPISFIAVISCNQDDNQFGLQSPGISNESYVIDSINPGDFKTYTQAGWGAPPFGRTPGGSYLHQNWGLLDTVIIGCDSTGGKHLTFTSSDAVRQFLPQGGMPAPLDTSYVNPTFRNNMLAGQVLALALSIKFDLADSSFGNSNNHLKDLCVRFGTFSGWTVGNVYNEANKVLGGCPSQYNAFILNDAITRINNNFIDGRFVGNYLHYCTSQ
jgi:hypothetical protein